MSQKENKQEVTTGEVVKKIKDSAKESVGAVSALVQSKAEPVMTTVKENVKEFDEMSTVAANTFDVIEQKVRSKAKGFLDKFRK